MLAICKGPGARRKSEGKSKEGFQVNLDWNCLQSLMTRLVTTQKFTRHLWESVIDSPFLYEYVYILWVPIWYWNYFTCGENGLSNPILQPKVLIFLSYVDHIYIIFVTLDPQLWNRGRWMFVLVYLSTFMQFITQTNKLVPSTSWVCPISNNLIK